MLLNCLWKHRNDFLTVAENTHKSDTNVEKQTKINVVLRCTCHKCELLSQVQVRKSLLLTLWTRVPSLFPWSLLIHGQMLRQALCLGLLCRLSHSSTKVLWFFILCFTSVLFGFIPFAVLRKLPRMLLPSNVTNKSETCNAFCSIKNRKTIHAIASLSLRLVLSSS